MKPDKRKTPQQRGRAPAGSRGRDVDPDQPFPDNPSPNDPEGVGDLDAAFAGKEHGEGNYQATKEYDKGVRSFVRSGRVERAAEEAKPLDREEARELAEAERQGRKRSKGEDSPAGGAKQTR